MSEKFNTYPTVAAAFGEVLRRTKDYGMPHVKLPIEAAEEVFKQLQSIEVSETCKNCGCHLLGDSK